MTGRPPFDSAVPLHGAPPRIAVVAPDPVVRNGFTELLADTGLEVVAPEEADLVLLDAGSNPENVATVLDEVGSYSSEVLLLVPDGEWLERGLQAGAQGVLLRTVEPSRLCAAVQAVHYGLGVIDGSFPVESKTSVDPHDDAAPEALTAREQEVLELIARGLSNRKIAKRLAISEHTVKFHVNSILQKFDAGSRTEAVVIAARHGFLLL
ncbi:MAG: response regulator transcription factor [Myxococcota bacterium]